MRTRTLTVASFFSIAMAATLLAALYTTQVRRPEPAQAATESPAAPAAPHAAVVPLGLETFRDIARAVNPGVVNINTSKTVKRPSFHDFFGDDMVERFFGPDRGAAPEGREQRQTQRSLGSGFVIDKDGYILTNRHVIEGAEKVQVTFPGGRRYDAKVVGRDARTDVGLLKIDAGEPLTALPLGDSDHTEVGEWVMAVGDPFDLPGGGNSVTVGVVSYVGRDLPLGAVRGTSVQMIQTDAAINPGNSGGPLINTRGEVVGINTLIVTGGSQANAGVGFSVPINVAKEILPQLREKGKVVRGWMGVSIQALSDDLARTYGLAEARGAYVSQVTPGSPAEKAGVQPEDVILSADGRAIQDNSDLSRYISSKSPGTSVRIELLRGKERKVVPVTLGVFQDETAENAEERGGRASLGMTLRDLNASVAERLELPRGLRGVLVTEVEPGEAAEDAGLVPKDVIVSVNGQAVDGVDAFDRAIEAAKPSGGARLRVFNQQAASGFRVVVLRLK
ncbi:MAG TPA: Do family serine endopeptidase [Vicinamibacteria bacterium]|nr:Do family serine endopeptidase [Vicinamibacteria bacterium]